MLQEYLKRTWSISVLDHLASQLGENWGQDQPTGGIQWMGKGDLLWDSVASKFYASSFGYKRDGERNSQYSNAEKTF